MNAKKAHFRRRSCSVLAWGALFFIIGHLLLGRQVQRRHPELFDAEFRLRLRDLRTRLAEAPGRPLALLLGSSRVAFGFRPTSAQSQRTSGEGEPLLYNFGMLGSGPVRQLMMLRRLLADGIRPTWLFVEVWPPFFPQRGFYGEEHNIFSLEMYWSDVPLMAQLYHRRREALRKAISATLTPLIHYRKYILDRYAPFLLPADTGEFSFGTLAWKGLDGWGWLPSPFPRPDAAGFDSQMVSCRGLTKPILDEFRIHPVTDRALRDLLEECRTRGIKTTLFILPEHSKLRSWYPPAAQTELAAYLHRLQEVYGTRVIDGRTWCPDDEFGDFCHLLPKGAQTLGERFGREVFRSLKRD